MSVQIFQWQSQLALAKNALICGDYLSAEEYLNAAMTFSHDENAPEDAVADIFYHRGICFENKDRFVDARRAFNQAQHTFSRCLGATSSQALKAGKAKCFVDIKMGRTAEAQSDFAEIIELLRRDPGDFAAEINAMETEMRDMLAHPASSDIPGTEVEIEEYAESWTPVRRPLDNTHLSVPDNSTVQSSFDFSSQKTSTHTPFSQQTFSQPAAFNSNASPSSGSSSTLGSSSSSGSELSSGSVSVSNAGSNSNPSQSSQLAPSSHTSGNGAPSAHSAGNGQRSNPGFDRGPAESAPASSRKLNIPSEVSDAIAHLSRSGQMAAVPESYLTGGVTGRLTVDPSQLVPPIIPGTDQDAASKEEAARKAEEEEQFRLAEELARQAEKEERARIEAEEAARKAEEDEVRVAAELALRMAEEEEARLIAEEDARKAEEEQKRLAAEEAEQARIAEEEKRVRGAAEEAARKAEEEAEERTRVAAEVATRRAEQEEKVRVASEEAALKAEEEEKARVAAEEAARKAEEEEKARVAAEEATHKSEEEEKTRVAAEEAARKTEEEAKARFAAEEAVRKAQENEEEKARVAAEEAVKKADEEKARSAAEEAAKKADEEKARSAAEEAAKKAEEEKIRVAAEEAAKKASEEKARVAAEEAARKAEEQQKLSLKAAVKTEEEARLEAEEAARKADEDARAAAVAARKAAQEEARIASAEAARKAREGKARVQFDADDEEKRISALSTEFEFDNSLALTSPSTATSAVSGAKTSSEASRESWVPPPMSAANANQTGAQANGSPGTQANASSGTQGNASSGAQASESDVKVRIVRSQPEAYASKRPDGTMIDLAAFQAPGGPVVPQEPNLSIVKAQNPYPNERRKEPPVRPDGLPERRSSILAQVADELTGQIAGKIESTSIDKLAADVATSLAAQVSEVAHAAEQISSPIDKTPDLQERARAAKLAGDPSPFQRPGSSEAPAIAPVAKAASDATAPQPTSQAASAVAPKTSSVAPTQHSLPKLNSFSSTASGAFATLATSGAHATLENSSLTKPTTTSSPKAMPASAAAASAPSAPSTAPAAPSKSTSASTPPATPLLVPTSTSTPSPVASESSATTPTPLMGPALTAPAAPPPQAPLATPVPNSPEAATEASSKAAATKNQAQSSAPLHTNTILDMPARTFNRTMMDMGAAEHERFEYGSQESLLDAPSGTDTPGNASGKSVDVAKLSEFQQRLIESANVSAPNGAASSFAPATSAENVVQSERSRTSFPDPNEGEDKFEKSRVSGIRPGRVPGGPVAAQKSLITPRHFIRPLNIPELTTANERKYTQAATIAAAVIYGLSVICLFGIILVPLIMFISHVLDGVRLGRMRGNGIKVTPEQFPEVFEAVHNLAASLGMQTAPETYVMNKPGFLNACAKNYHQRDYVIIYTDILELAYSFGESELAFVISHELAHIQCGHLKRKWLDFPAKLVPFLGQALSRAREYTCDRIAQELVPEGASVGLVALSVGTKLFRRINLKALYAQQDSVDDFWSSFSEAVSSKPNLNSRIRALAPGEDRTKSSKSTTAAPTKKR